jgi:hypothetical protein
MLLSGGGASNLAQILAQDAGIAALYMYRKRKAW